MKPILWLKTALSLSLWLALVTQSARADNQDQKLIDATIATVGGKLIWQSDLEKFYALRHLATEKSLLRAPKRFDDKSGREQLNELIQVEVIWQYLFRVADKHGASSKEGIAAWESLVNQLGAEQAQFFATYRWHETGCRDFLEKIATAGAFLDKLDARGRASIGTAQVQAYFEQHKESKFLGQKFEQLSGPIRRHLEQQAAHEAIEAWIQDQKSRTNILYHR